MLENTAKKIMHSANKLAYSSIFNTSPLFLNDYCSMKRNSNNPIEIRPTTRVIDVVIILKINLLIVCMPIFSQ